MQVVPGFNHRGETNLEFRETIIAQETSTRPALKVHGHVRTLTGDRLAVTSALLIGSAITEQLTVGRPVSKRVASEIRRFLSDDRLDFPESTEVPLAVHTGSVELRIHTDAIDALTSPVQTDRRRIRFAEFPSHSNAGRFFTFDKLLVASNSWIFSSDGSAGARRDFETSLAVPVLMAQDLSASKIDVPARLVEGRTPDDINRVARLLASTDILLAIEGEPVHAY